MKSKQTDNIPFAFELTKKFLPAEDNTEEDIQPISNREFYTILVFIIILLVAVKYLLNFVHP